MSFYFNIVDCLLHNVRSQKTLLEKNLLLCNSCMGILGKLDAASPWAGMAWFPGER